MPTGGTIVDSLFVALGFVPSYEGLDAFKARAEEGATSMLKYGAAAGVAIGALVTKAVVDVSDQFEQNTIAIAGFFDALGVSSNFNAGMKDAADTMDQIIRDAALLPGEADEYIEIFRAGLPIIKDAVPNMDVGQITDFTNKIAAIGHTLKVPAEVASREMQELFIKGEGHATRINILFKRFLPFLRQVEGQANLTTKSFNAMTAEKRVELFKASFQKLNPMLERSASSFDAMKGAIISAAKTLARKGGESLFEGTKRGIAKLNAAFFTADGKLTSLSQRIVEVGNKIGGMVTQAVSSMSALVEWFVTSDRAMTAVKVTAVLLGLAMAGLAFESVAKGVMTLFYALTNLKRLFTGALVVAIGLVADDLYTFATGGESVTGMLVEKFGPAAEWIAYAVLPALGAALAFVHRQAIKTGVQLALTWAAAIGPTVPLIAAIAAVGYGILKLYENWDTVTKALGIDWDAFTARFSEAWAAASAEVGALVDELVTSMAAAWREDLKPALDDIVAILPDMQTGFAIFGAIAKAVLDGAIVGVHAFGTVVSGLRLAFEGMAAAWKITFGPILSGIHAARAGLEALGLISPKSEAAALGPGEGVTLPGPTGASFSPSYAPRGALPGAGTPEGPGYSASAMGDQKKAGLLDRLKAAFPKVDIASMMGGVGGLQPAGFGGGAVPSGWLGGGKGGGTTTVTENYTFGDMKFEGDPMNKEDVRKFAESLKDEMRREQRESRHQERRNVNARVSRNNGSGEEG